MNKAIIMGRLTADPELKTVGDNISTCTVTVAVDRRTKKEDGSRDADFIRVVFWRQQAEFLTKYFSKGSRIAVVGRIQTRQYEDKEGQKRSSTEVVAEEVHFADSKKQGDGGEYKPRFDQPAPGAAQTDFSGIVPDDDISIPFDL